MNRRGFLRLSGGSVSCLISTGWLASCGGGGSEMSSAGAPPSVNTPTPAPGPQSNLANIGPLVSSDANGIRLPAGFSSRVVARSGSDPTGGSGYLWHPAPDGGATFADGSDGWVYVSNSEMPNGNGGVGALRFDRAGRLVDAYPILEQTSRNCAGGATPWQTWLSCEEYAEGLVWECDPLGRNLAKPLPALGRFNHEAAAVDPATGRIYLTEDQPDGGWYRFTPDTLGEDGRPDLSSGVLAIARVDNGQVQWVEVPDPSGSTQPTRYQVDGATAFNGGEGSSFDRGTIYFTTKGDNRVCSYDVTSSTLSIIYDANTNDDAILRGVDNVETNGLGDIIVAEDGGNMELVVITRSGDLAPLLQVVGQDASEITGPAFTPDLSRLYFSSQTGVSGSPADGITYEITGPFLK